MDWQAVVRRFRPFCGVAIFLLIASGWLCSSRATAEDLAAELKRVPFQIVFETYRDGNWELFKVNADGSQPTNLTRTPTIHETYPHVSPDGTKVSFVVDEEDAGRKIRNVYVMNLDGSGRRLVATNAREPFWNPTGTAVVYAKGESEKFTVQDYVTRGIFVFDLAAGTETEHPNRQIHHLYNMCMTPDGKWYVSTVHAGMGCGHAILALEAGGSRVINLQLPGCRPDVSPDGKKVAWGADDFTLRVGELDFTGPEPRVVRQRDVVKSQKPMETYHVDWSPDGKYLAFSYGPMHKRLGPAPEMVGVEAEGWNLCVADAAATNRWVAITTDGKSNKEPDWVPLPKEKP
jgi:Tol biopolymer transport system component